MTDHQTLAATPLCHLLGCRTPLILAGMGGVARAELTAAVSGFGGFGFLGMVREPLALMEREVAAVRAATDQPFGVNLIPAGTPRAHLRSQVDLCIALTVPAVELFWDVDEAVIDRLRAAGIIVVHQVGSAAEALQAQAAGAHAVIAQGVEAGGHVRGRQPLMQVLAEVLGAVSIPVAAAGGLADGRDVGRVLALGAQAAVLGTALMATTESFAHQVHKERLVAGHASETLLTEDFHVNWPPLAAVRVLANSVTRGERGDPFTSAPQVIGEEEGRPIYLFSTDSPLRSMTGDLAAMAIYAGRGVEHIDAIVPAAERLARINQDAAAHLALVGAAPAPLASPVCYAGEFEQSAQAPLRAELAALLGSERALATLLSETCAQARMGSEQHALLALLLRAQVQGCGVLVQALRSVDGVLETTMVAEAQEGRALALPQRLDWLAAQREKLLVRWRALAAQLGAGALASAWQQALQLHEAALIELKMYSGAC